MAALQNKSETAGSVTPTVRCVSMKGQLFIKFSKSALSLLGADKRNASPRSVRVLVRVDAGNKRIGLRPRKRGPHYETCCLGKVTWLLRAMERAGFKLEPGKHWVVRPSTVPKDNWEIVDE